MPIRRALALLLGVAACGRGPSPAPPPDASAPPAAPDDAIDVVLGEKHACRLLRAGSVECWGMNDVGQLGDGTIIDRPTPVRVKDLDDAVALAAGWQGTCAARRDGSVWCWGRHPTWDGPAPWEHPRSAPQKLDGYSNVVSLGLARGAILTLDRAGNVGGPAGKTGPSEPVRALSVGFLHACAISTAGRAVCWKLESDSHWPAGGTRVPELKDREIAAISASEYDNGCAITKEGELVCFPAPDRPSRLDSPPRISHAAMVAADERNTCAVTTDGRVGCFGPEGGLRWIEGITDATKVVVAGATACALRRTGDVVCWGNGGTGQLGNGATAVWRAPVAVRGLPRITQIAATSLEQFALTEDGRLFRWGGARGQGSTGPQVESIEPVARLFASRGEACARLRSGRIMCKRSTSSGTTPSSLLGNVIGAWEPIDALSDVADMQGVWPHYPEREGEHRSSDDLWYVLHGSGKVSVFATAHQRQKPIPVRGISKATSLGVASGHACVVLEGGKASCWHHHPLEYDAVYGYSKETSARLVTVPLLKDAERAEGACLLRKTGESACFGMPFGGGSVWPVSFLPDLPWARPHWAALCTFYGSDTLTCHGAVLDLEKTAPAGVRQAAISQDATCVLNDAGEVACWGDNHAGHVGQSATWMSERASPVARVGR